MKARPAILAILLPLAGITTVACKTQAVASTRNPQPPVKVATLDQFHEGFNMLVRLPEGSPQRAEYRQVLLAFLLDYLDQASDRGDLGEAVNALEYAGKLYTAAELRTVTGSPSLARRARRVYRDVSRRGAENPAMLALAIEQRFGDDAQREHALRSWKQVERWLVDNGRFSEDPLLRHEDLESTLKRVTSTFPSPFAVERLADLYVARYDLVRKGRVQGRAIGSAGQRRLEATGYLLMLLYMRADDFDGALAAMDRVALDAPVAKLRGLMIEAMKPRRSALSLLALIEQFIPGPDENPSPSDSMERWGIVDNLARRAVRRYPKDAYAHLVRARGLANEGLLGAAVFHLRTCISIKEDIFEAWPVLASLQHQDLARVAAADPEAAYARLQELETFHQRAAKLWSDRPIHPRLTDAYYVVAQSLYDSGEVDRAKSLLERSVDVEPAPDAIDLLGTIALKSSDLPGAQARYENLANMAYEDETVQLHWEARARHKLGQIALQRGRDHDSTRHIRIALRHTNDLLARPSADRDERASRYLDRGALLFALGDVKLAMADFGRASELAPDRVGVYADPLRALVAHGYYAEAQTIFRRAMAQGALAQSLKLYFVLWLNELALRQGQAPDAQVADFLNSYEGDRWGKQLARHAQGALPFNDLLASANGRGERAEAYFYEGLRRWRAGDEVTGKQMMRKVLDSRMMGFFEYDMAKSYLRWGELPRQARPVLPTHTSGSKTSANSKPSGPRVPH